MNGVAAPPRIALDGMAVAVVGASRGIGAGAALACAAAGAESVTVMGRTEAGLEAVAEQVTAAGAEAAVRRCDVTATDEIEAAFASLPRLDAVVVAAGGNQPEPFAAVAPETFDRLFALNVRGAFFAAQAAVARMPAERGGAVVFVSSQMGHVGAPERTVYCATKHALEGLTKAMAVELAPRRIRVVSVAPTFVRTEMTAAQLDDPETGGRLRAQIPLGRPATPEEVADAVTWLASPRAAMTTGSSLLVDGGWTAR
jgi:NAD(P)-dependent dehydrogenase (short-subunit alcohol dehydrogenase family)